MVHTYISSLTRKISRTFISTYYDNFPIFASDYSLQMQFGKMFSASLKISINFFYLTLYIHKYDEEATDSSLTWHHTISTWTEIIQNVNSWHEINMICGLSLTYSHTSKITKWPHILVIPLVGSPKPRTKSKNSPTHPETEKRETKVVILGDFRGGLRVLFHRFQTWACGY